MKPHQKPRDIYLTKFADKTLTKQNNRHPMSKQFTCQPYHHHTIERYVPSQLKTDLNIYTFALCTDS